MGIVYTVDRERRLLFEFAAGPVTADQFREHIEQVWKRPEFAGFDCVLDLRWAEGRLTFDEIRGLVDTLVEHDEPGTRGRTAVIADPRSIDLARGYAEIREATPGSAREVRAFESDSPSRAWLGLPETPRPFGRA